MPQTAKPFEIVICLGSSCFSRANKQIVNIIQQYINDEKMREMVNFKGGHCFGHCVNGPVLKINDSTYFNINPENVKEILKKTVKKH